MSVLVRMLILTLVVTSVPVGMAQAACGIGNKIWQGRSGTLPKLAAFTTNVWTFKAISTTFAIAGCTKEDRWFVNNSDEVRYYASTNFDHLAADMARGRGEHLAALSALLQVREPDEPYFQAFAQQHVPALLPDDEVTSDEMLLQLRNLMAGDARLSIYVRG